MLKIIKLEVEDINTRQYGSNFLIEVDDNNHIILSDKAAKELYEDLGSYIKANSVVVESKEIDGVAIEVRGGNSVVKVNPVYPKRRVIKEGL